VLPFTIAYRSALAFLSNDSSEHGSMLKLADETIARLQRQIELRRQA
jgi:hypothetical protein